MKPLTVFASKFGGKVALNPEFVVEHAQRYYLLNPALRKIVKRNFYCAGMYLGKVKGGVFFPSFNLLNMLVPIAANKVILDRKAAWLFICGRDIFRKGIVQSMGSQRRGDCTLVLNEYGECLGFGMLAADLGDASGRVVFRNVLDVGDFLRREG
ncbi:MAG: hypothetical protein NWF05_08735 [Candidatus Bathyarchaeota archaeon]|nr:hypothetical protein [Candidatus Bathyarchaeota archaeon]